MVFHKTTKRLTRVYQEDRLLALPICRGHYHLSNRLRNLPQDFYLVLSGRENMKILISYFR